MNDGSQSSENNLASIVRPSAEGRQCSFLAAPLREKRNGFQLCLSLRFLLRRYMSFGIVGAAGIGVDMAALFVLADPRMLHLDVSLGKGLAAEIAIFSNFIGNELWTFRDRTAVDLTWQGRATRFCTFNLICLAGIGLSVLLLEVQTRYFRMNMYAGNLIAIGIVSIWNFGMNYKFGWKISGTREKF